MKKLVKSSLYAGLLVAVIVLTGCQKEKYNVDDPKVEGEAIMASSATAKLIEQTVSNDGSYDNIVDGASCFDIRFPYTVNVNGLEITIDSKEDLHVVEEIFDAVENDENLLDIIFPVTITMADYTEITINGEADLHALAAKCTEGGGDDDIECIDVVYPVKFFTLDINSIQTGSVVVESDKDMRRFFAGLGENDLISIQFPVVFIMYDGTEVRANNNAELAEAIEMAKDACDEDDNNDYNDDDFTKERLDNLLVECPWLIRDLMRDNQLQTEQYFEYLMNFSEDGSVNVIDRLGKNISGSWSTRVSDYRVLLTLEFDVLVDFNLEWFVYEIKEGKIKLYEKEGNRIIMENACNVNAEPNTLREILRECSWIIKKVKVDGDEIRRLLGYEFNFMAEGALTLSQGDIVSNGTWEITTNTQGRLVMAIVMGDEPGVSFEWPLSDLRNDRLKFEIPGTDYELILQRVCDDSVNDGDVVEIQNSMIAGGAWMVAKFMEDGEDKVSAFSGYDFVFQSEHLVHITIGETGPTYPGYWRVIRNSENDLKVYLNLGEQDPLGDLTDDWDFVSITSDRIELRDVSGGNGGIDVLVFERK